MLLALCCVAWLLYFIHHISQAISVSHIVDRIASETEGIIDDVMPQPREDQKTFETLPRELETWDIPLLSESSGYIRFVDTRRLVALAKFHHVKIRAVRRVGQFVPAGTPLVLVYKSPHLKASPNRSARALPLISMRRPWPERCAGGRIQRCRWNRSDARAANRRWPRLWVRFKI